LFFNGNCPFNFSLIGWLQEIRQHAPTNRKPSFVQVADTKKTYVEPVMNKLQDVTDTTAKACGDVVSCSKQLVSSTMVNIYDLEMAISCVYFDHKKRVLRNYE
jgi:hypothetical protein